MFEVTSSNQLKSKFFGNILFFFSSSLQSQAFKASWVLSRSSTTNTESLQICDNTTEVVQDTECQAKKNQIQIVR